MKIINWYRIICVVITVLICLTYNNSLDSAIVGDTYSESGCFVIDKDVSFYKNEVSSGILQKISYFEPLSVISTEIINKRINVKLDNNSKGWIEFKYTSLAAKDWQKKVFNKIYFCYIPPDISVNFTKIKQDKFEKYEYRSEDFMLSFVESNTFGYEYKKKQLKKVITERINSYSSEKDLNWQKEFYYGHYKINYTITSAYADMGILEIFDFINLNENFDKKKYSFSISYDKSIGREKQIRYRKILFSTLQSLR